MTSNPFEAPKASLEVPPEAEDLNPTIEKRIKCGWIAGVVSAGYTLVLFVLSLMGRAIPGIDGWSIIDIFIAFGLSYGVFRRSRTCAVLLLVLFLLNKVILWTISPAVADLPFAFVFACFLGAGVVGTFQYHRLNRGANVAA